MQFAPVTGKAIGSFDQQKLSNNISDINNVDSTNVPDATNIVSTQNQDPESESSIPVAAPSAVKTETHKDPVKDPIMVLPATPKSGNTESEGKKTCSHQCKEKGDCSEDEDEDYEKIDVVKHCMQSNKEEIIEVDEVKHLRGKNLLKVGAMRKISDCRGETVINGNGSKISDIEDIRGSLIICNAEVDQIKNVRGGILLVNSKVKNLDDHRGNVKFFGSSAIENRTNSHGSKGRIDD